MTLQPITAVPTRAHHVVDPDIAHRPSDPHDRVPDGMSVAEAADRIVATLLQGSGPILLCVPGTTGGAFEFSMLSVARAFVALAPGSVSVSSIPYRNGPVDCVTRLLRIGTSERENLLAQVLLRLHERAPNRPIVLAGESQGAWLIDDTLRENQTLAAIVSRVVLFATPGFVAKPTGVGAARQGAQLLGGDATGIVEYRHTDDIVPNLFANVRLGVITPLLDALLSGGGVEHLPHYYGSHGDEAARWLLFGQRPTTPLDHPSTADQVG